MRRFAIGDIHGGYKSLVQCIERSKADIEKDRFIILGDIVDGWPEAKKCVDFILKMKDYIFILGNHDEWFYHWVKTDVAKYEWINQGGLATLKSYEKTGVPNSHKEFFKNAKLYHEESECLFVHGGICAGTKAKENGKDTFLWDRNLARISCCQLERKDVNLGSPHYKKIFIGHTTTGLFNKIFKPIYGAGVWNLDTGGGWEGKLTIMDIDTEEYWQSDFVYKLYPESRGR